MSRRTAGGGRPTTLGLWARVVGIALVAALGIRLLGAEAFRIPTSSMEKTLLVGDFVLVSKLHYGARTPITLGLPFTDWYLDAELPSVRLPGFGAVRRGDVIVFNLPTERRPVDRKTPFIKRVVGVPGDTVALVGKEVRVNGEAVPLAAGMQQGWRVVLDPAVPFSPESFRRLGVRAPVERASGGEWLVRMTPAQADTVDRRHHGLDRADDPDRIAVGARRQLRPAGGAGGAGRARSRA